MSALTIETVGRRHYIHGNTYPLRERLRAVGAKWDSNARAWWTGKREVAEQVVNGSEAPAQQGESPEQPQNESTGESTVVAARATYQGRAYYVVGKVVRGRTHWDDRVRAVMTRDESKYLLSFRDGSKQFWAARGAVQVTKSYDRPATIGSIARFTERARQEEADGRGCYMCGSISCDGAKGSLCEHD